jgi:hypothetical protein
MEGGVIMALVETSRVKELLGIHIGVIQEYAMKLDAGSDLQVLEANMAELEKALGDLKDDLAGIPHRHG